MDDATKREFFQRVQTADSIKQEFEQTLAERVERHLQVKPHEIIPNAPFAAPSAECSLLFRDWYYRITSWNRMTLCRCLPANEAMKR